MLTDTAAIRTYFAKLGLETEIADLYLTLHSFGPQNISELSRNSGVERTRIYRLIDKLLESNLVELESRHRRGMIKAAPIANLNILISQKEQELKSLHDELGLIQQVLARNSLSDPATHVQFYQGAEGVRQMQWNLLKAKGEVLSIVYKPLEGYTGGTFHKRWSERWDKTGNARRMLMGTPSAPEKAKNYQARELSNDIMPITFATDIYDETVSYYNWQGDEVFGIEIHNKNIANAQRAFFGMLWTLAAPPIKRR